MFRRYDSDSVLDVDVMEQPNLALGEHRNAYLREWMVRNGKGRMEGDEFVPSEDNPITKPNARGTFAIRKEWYHYKEGEDPPAAHVPWIAEMMNDLLAERRERMRSRRLWEHTMNMFQHALDDMQNQDM